MRRLLRVLSSRRALLAEIEELHEEVQRLLAEKRTAMATAADAVARHTRQQDSAHGAGRTL